MALSIANFTAAAFASENSKATSSVLFANGQPYLIDFRAYVASLSTAVMTATCTGLAAVTDVPLTAGGICDKTRTVSGVDMRHRLYWGVGNGTTTTLTISWPQSVFAVGRFNVYTLDGGVSTSSPFVKTFFAEGLDAVGGVGFDALADANNLEVASVHHYKVAGTGSVTPDTGWNEVTDNQNNDQGSVIYHRVGSDTTFTCQLANSQDFITFGLEITAAAAGGSRPRSRGMEGGFQTLQGGLRGRRTLIAFPKNPIGWKQSASGRLLIAA